VPDSKAKDRRSGLAGQESTVSRLIGQSTERQREKATGGRGKAEHGGQLGQDKTGRSKATYDVSLNRQDLIRLMAQQEDVSQSDIVEVAIVGLYNAWQSGQINLQKFKSSAHSLKASWKLDIPDTFSFHAKK
jgi:hypothetical protein